MPKPTPISPDAFYDCVEEIPALKKELKSLVRDDQKPERQPEIIKEAIIESQIKQIDETLNVPSSSPTKPIVPLERRLSNVERFLKESSPEPESIPRENSRMMLGIVYSSCALVAVQFYVLIAALLSTKIPFGLMFLVVCLCIIVSLISQICFCKSTKHEKRETVSRKRRRNQSTTVESTQTECSKNKIILECERRGKPVAPVKPFRLVRIPSTKELFSVASDLLKKKL